MTGATTKEAAILVVDDEPDILEIIEELLDEAILDTAPDFETAAKMLADKAYDLAILDVMGVRGFELLKKSVSKGFPTVMLTAHALSPDNIKKSYLGGACSYIPKEEMINIASFLEDILKAKEQGKNPWTSWYGKMASFFEKKFGPNWQKDEKDFWEKFPFY